MTSTFELCDVPRARTMLAEVDAREAIETITGGEVEACGGDVAQLCGVRHNAVLTAVWYAFGEHRPLVLTPDAVWLCLAQGFAAHMSLHAEALRDRFVRHEGRQRLVVRRDDLRKGSPDNPWPEVFAEFSQQIAGHIGRQRDLVVCDFSTTGAIERAASELVLMDAMQQYFSYELNTLCGIPEVTLTGTVDDWVRLRHKALALAEYGLEWWTRLLAPVLDEFVAAARGRPDVEFWHHLFKERHGSGGTKIRGWIHVLFPYVTDGGPQAKLRENWVLRAAGGVSPIRDRGGPAAWVVEREMSPDCIPLGLARAPLSWNYFGEVLAMELVGGFVGVAQDPASLAVRPAIGWAIREEGPAVVQHVDRTPEPRSRPIREELDREQADRIFLACEGVRCSWTNTPIGRLILAGDGLYFIPAPSSGAISHHEGWIVAALHDDEEGSELSPAMREYLQLARMSPSYQEGVVEGSIHVTSDELAVFTVEHRVTRDGTLILTIHQPRRQALEFALADSSATMLQGWLRRMGKSWRA
ncbi:DUF4419 domain-containing protein [Nannocystis pusilla]|uniref:DUF4419 domain-containing protein n=1 Tax=Nannocystis pusilla TaxID=889268 RepID=A0ABS7TUG3_9BACT|nr:DUF4419 domain-containing protein [Nannocystis pusilla]MBZ5711860.1 DUF4419 domain-containing protein [Nannocystis pusilla]